MNKVYGRLSDFGLIRRDFSRHIIGYNLTPVGDGEHYTWNEIYLYKKQHPTLTMEDVKQLITEDINAMTKEKILSGFEWNGIKVWLSDANQRNFSDAQRIAVQTEGESLPVRFKLGETSEGEAIYHTFETLRDINNFYLAMVQYIQECLTNGWAMKDGMVWGTYEKALEMPQQ